MRDYEYTSAFAREIELFLAYKESLGFYGRSRRWYLLDFDRHCAANGLADFDRETVEGWVIGMDARNPGGYRSWMSYIRDLGRYMAANGRTDAYVLSGSFAARPARPTPYLLSEREIGAFFGAAWELDARPPLSWEMACFFGLMYACGLRTCEARGLAVGDVDAGGGHIDVLWSKGSRSRRLYLSGEVAAALAECGSRTADAFGADREAFFVNSAGRPISPCAAGTYFNRIWDAAGLARPEGGRRPRPYDFRHHFAYANIERWAADGLDVMAMVPYLARYMGHASFDSTLYYVHTSPGFLAGYAGMAAPAGRLLPEVGFDA